MCKVGDIILVEHFKVNGQTIPRHSFIVVSDQDGQIEGMNYDLINVLLTSVKSEKQEFFKLGFPGNFYIDNKNTNTTPNNGKDGIAMCDILYFFNKSKIKYKKIGNIDYETTKELMDFIENSEHDISENIENL